MELFSRGEIGSDNEAPVYGINVGPHKFAVACLLSEEMADLIVASANVFAMAARDLGGTPLERAEAIGGNLANIGKALVWSREALQQIRELIEDAGHEWPPHTWDNIHGVPGHALHLITEALELFPPIKFTQPIDEQGILIKELREALDSRVDSGKTKEDILAVKDLIARADKALGDQ